MLPEEHAEHRGLTWVFVRLMGKLRPRIAWMGGKQQLVVFSIRPDDEYNFVFERLVDFIDPPALQCI
ncbi:Uncharacterised protein [Mycobacteroides abscessus subsp. abscessus]|nr:Uncharacterised protein [Mycobacteroides abscessus subsp. abscessus]